MYVLINPEILETSGSQTGEEGCLSVPGMSGVVTRPDYVKVKAYDENMEEFILEGTELLARAICHEDRPFTWKTVYRTGGRGTAPCKLRGGRIGMKVVFMGTPDFAVGTLEEIVKAGHEVAAVVTQPDKPRAEERL